MMHQGSRGKGRLHPRTKSQFLQDGVWEDLAPTTPTWPVALATLYSCFFSENVSCTLTAPSIWRDRKAGVTAPRSALVLSGGQDHCRPSQPTLITRLSPAAVWAVMVTPDTAEVARVQLEYFTQKASGLHRQSSKQSIIRLWNKMCALNRFPEGKNEKKM